VVEDDLRLRRPLTLTLRAHGYDVVAVADGGSALEEAAARIPDLVVLDLGLPDMDGTQVIERLRAWSAMPGLQRSPRWSSPSRSRLTWPRNGCARRKGPT